MRVMGGRIAQDIWGLSVMYHSLRWVFPDLICCHELVFTRRRSANYLSLFAQGVVSWGSYYSYLMVGSAILRSSSIFTT